MTMLEKESDFRSLSLIIPIIFSATAIYLKRSNTIRSGLKNKIYRSERDQTLTFKAESLSV